MIYTVRRFVQIDYGVYNGVQIIQTDDPLIARSFIPYGWKRTQSNDQANYIEDITISDDVCSYEVNGSIFSGFYERYVKEEYNENMR